MARESGSSEASIIRFCNRMGFDGYSGLKQAFTAALTDGGQVTAEGIDANDDIITILKKIFRTVR